MHGDRMATMALWVNEQGVVGWGREIGGRWRRRRGEKDESATPSEQGKGVDVGTGRCVYKLCGVFFVMAVQ